MAVEALTSSKAIVLLNSTSCSSRKVARVQACSYVHRIELCDEQVKAIVTIEGERADAYYLGLAADPEALYEAADRKVGAGLALLLKTMRDKLKGLYGA